MNDHDVVSTPLPKIARCPYCRAAGREAQRGTVSAVGRWVVCPVCDATGAASNTSQADAIAAWNAVARLAKRGAKRERGADIAEIARGLVGQRVYIEWRDGSDWHWFEVRRADRENVVVYGLIAPDGTEWSGSPFLVRPKEIKSIRPLSNEEWGYE